MNERSDETVGTNEAIEAVTAAFAARLRRAIGERSIRSVAQTAGLNHTTVGRLVRGERLPDLATVVRLERALDTDLWPAEAARQVRPGRS